MELLFTGILFSLGVGILIAIHVCIIGRAFRGRFGTENAVEQSCCTKSKTMSRDDFDKLPCFDYKGEDKEEGPMDCAVCLENFKKGDKCRLLPDCSHSFHVQCIDSWLMKTPFCPVCRTCACSTQPGQVERH